MGDRRIEVQPSLRDVRDDADGSVPAEAPPEVSKEELLRRKRTKRLRAYALKGVKRGVRMIGLIALTFGYIAFGGWMFKSLEKTNDVESCASAEADYLGNENATIELLMDVSSRLDGISTYTADQLANLQSQFGQLLDDFDLAVLGAGFRVNETDCSTYGVTDDNPSRWEFMPAALFAMTIIATIGYGNIAPVTTWGRVVCIAYALAGIPLFMFVLVSAGSILAFLVRTVYQTCCCLGCCRKRGGGGPHGDGGDEEVLIATEEGQASRAVVKGDGQLPDPGNDPALTSEGAEPKENDGEKLEEEEEEEEDEAEAPKLPIIVSLVILCSLVLIGGLIFSPSEEWPLIDAAYFAFITITSIGFGDFVPGTSVDRPAKVFLQSLLGIVYIIFGMAGFSMVISLIVDEISAKMEWFSAKCKRKRAETEDDRAETVGDAN